MNILHIGDSASGGGAAHAMSWLHGSLQRLGFGSRLLVRNGPAGGSGAETVATRGDADELFPPIREALVRQYVELNRTALTNTHFSLYVDGADLARVPLVESSDIVHLHWTASFQTPADVRALLEAKPVVWTLHDLGPLTGGCHFPAGCERYADGCRECPQLVRDPFGVTATTLSDKKTLWAGSGMTLIAPSRYMADLARRSAVAQAAQASIVHIPHGIDVEAFRPLPKAAARRALGIPVDGRYVLCGSNHNAEMRKGLRLLDRVLAAAGARSAPGVSEMKLLTVGEPKLDLHLLDGGRIIQLGRVSADVMPSVYAAADVFLHPSLEDNFPCMLLESLSCGTPPVAFGVGGVPEIVPDGVGGRFVPAGDELAMGAALADLLGDGEALQRMSERARAHVEERFSDVLLARKHAELYESLVESRAALPAPADRSQKTGIEEIFPRWSTACLVQELALARERASKLVEESRAKSEHIAALARGLADLHRQVHEKEAELNAIHAVAKERQTLSEELHAFAASIQAVVANLQREVREREDLFGQLQATIGEQRAEIELVHRVAADRQILIEDLHSVAEQRAAVIDQLSSPPDGRQYLRRKLRSTRKKGLVARRNAYKMRAARIAMSSA